MIRDLRFAWRSLARTPAFALSALVSLAIAIGASTSIFTLADQILLRPLPVDDPHSLVRFEWDGRFVGGSLRGGHQAFSYPAYRALRAASPEAFTGIAARYQEVADVFDKQSAERASIELVSGNYFEVLGVTPGLGRTITPADDEMRDHAPVVVLSDDYWKRRFGGDAAVLNRSIHVNGRLMTIVGVSRRGFSGFDVLRPADMFVPIAMKRTVTPAWDDLDRRDSAWLMVFARFNKGIAAHAAVSELQVIYARILQDDVAALGRNDDFRRQYQRNRIQLADASKGFARAREFLAMPMRVLIAMAAVFLLIACVNVAGLLVTRSAARRKEVAIRQSLGATPVSIVRLLITESLLLAITGGALGVLLSVWMTAFLIGLMPSAQSALALNSSPDLRILAFSGAVTLLTALTFGLLPALQATRPETAPALRAASPAFSSSLHQMRLRRLLVAVQITLSVLLLVSAGWFSRSLYQLLSTDTGLKHERLFAFSLNPSPNNYSPHRINGFFLEVQKRLRQTTGVTAASAASFPVLAGVAWENTLSIEKRPARPGEDMQAGWNQVLPDFFSTLGVPLIAGREFTERDTDGAPKVAIVNESFVRRFFSGTSPLGSRIGFGTAADMEIVGVVRDFKSGTLRDGSKPWTWTPALQNASPSTMTFYSTFDDNAAAPADIARGVVAGLDPGIPVYDLKTIKAQINETHFTERIFAVLSVTFALMATLLAMVGVFGLLSYTVASRTKEMGIRIALGADRADIVRLVVLELIVVGVPAIAAGLAVSVVWGRMLESQLYGFRADDKTAILIAVTAIALASAVACFIPCRRAARVDPVQTLRWE